MLFDGRGIQCRCRTEVVLRWTTVVRPDPPHERERLYRCQIEYVRPAHPCVSGRPKPLVLEPTHITTSVMSRGRARRCLCTTGGAGASLAHASSSMAAGTEQRSYPVGAAPPDTMPEVMPVVDTHTR